jgi:predicted signal transduction protein with EAL and GGDEF domain
LGGDEFAVLLPGVEHGAEAAFVGAHILREVNRPMTFGRRKFAVSACCGLAIAERGGQSSPSRVMADADLALYEAKDSAAGGVCVFEARLESPRRRRQQIERALQVPGVEDQFRLDFQAIVHLSTGRVLAYEALARWTAPELGPVSPAEFVPIAEQLNLIDGINNHLMAKAFEEAARWPATVGLSFNLSAVQLCASGSAETLLDALVASGLPAAQLQVEVTETALLAYL